MKRVVMFLASFLLLFGFANCDLTQYPVQRNYIYTYKAVTDQSPKRVIPILIDKRFSETDKRSLRGSISQWNYVLNSQMLLEVVDLDFTVPNNILDNPPKNVFIIRMVSNNSSELKDEPFEKCKKNDSCTLAWVNGIGGTVANIIRDRIADKDVAPIALHEIGHMLYLSHVENRDMLMYPKYEHSNYLCVEKDSAIKVARQYHLDENSLNYCQLI